MPLQTLPLPFDVAAQRVLAQYPQPSRAAPIALGNLGGFSGAKLWRVPGEERDYCLRVWPEGGPGEQDLEVIHSLMRTAREHGLSCVPEVFANRAGKTWCAWPQLWELTEWLPGRADFHEHPTPERMAAACTTLARLHLAWAEGGPSNPGRSHGLLHRGTLTYEWFKLLESGWQPAFQPDSTDPVQPWAERAWALLPRLIRELPPQLKLWVPRNFTLQPCLCDIWHNHVLFTGDVVTGLVDYGNVKRDAVVVDLARMLGSMAGDDAALRAAGLSAYKRIWYLSLEEEELIHFLDISGTILGIGNWLRWLYYYKRRFEDRARVANRLAELVQRVERWAK